MKRKPLFNFNPETAMTGTQSSPKTPTHATRQRLPAKRVRREGRRLINRALDARASESCQFPAQEEQLTLSWMS